MALIETILFLLLAVVVVFVFLRNWRATLVAAVALESLVKLGAFLVVGAYVTWGLFDGPTDIWARAAASI